MRRIPARRLLGAEPGYPIPLETSEVPPHNYERTPQGASKTAVRGVGVTLFHTPCPAPSQSFANQFLMSLPREDEMLVIRMHHNYPPSGGVNTKSRTVLSGTTRLFLGNRKGRKPLSLRPRLIVM